ncbi:MAG: isoprenylcysteine carboxylmethyltransferase family protein [Anaerolineales bacterium]|nr:isoprenylcysteine carboxylmethyltransferase family protein [Anaerolineales bacterium]
MQAFLRVMALVLVYGGVHSLLAASSTKRLVLDVVGKRAYLGLYALGFNVLSVVTLLPVLWGLAVDAGPVIWQVSGVLAGIMMVIQGLGLLGLVIAGLQIDLMRFVGVRQALAWLNGDPLPLPPEPLQTEGVYAISRHPLYLFSLLLIWPTPVMLSGWFGFCVAATVYFMVGSRLEERKLRAVFGDAYQRYQQRVPWLVPFIRWG